MPATAAPAPGIKGAIDWLKVNGNNMEHILDVKNNRHNWDKVVNQRPNIRANVVENYEAIMPVLQDVVTSSPETLPPMAENGGWVHVWKDVLYNGQLVTVKVYEYADGTKKISDAYVKGQ